MTGLTPRSLLPVCLLIGLVSACAHRSSSNPAPRDTAAPGPPGRTVTSRDIERAHGQPIEQVLEERFPGVSVVRTAEGGIAIRIRGSTSLVGNNDPLYVIDGVPAVPGRDGGLTGINPHEIASIEVLKDPGSTAMYGARGANGVIIIKTKRSPPP